MIQIRSARAEVFPKGARATDPPARVATRRPSGRRRGRNVNRPPRRWFEPSDAGLFFFSTPDTRRRLSLSLPSPAPTGPKERHGRAHPAAATETQRPRRRTRKNPPRAARHRAEGREPRLRRRRKEAAAAAADGAERERAAGRRRAGRRGARGTTSTSTPRVGCKVRAGRGKGGAWARGATRSPARGPMSGGWLGDGAAPQHAHVAAGNANAFKGQHGGGGNGAMKKGQTPDFFVVYTFLAEIFDPDVPSLVQRETQRGCPRWTERR